MGVYSDGSYGADKGLYFSFPVVCKGGNYEIVQGLKLDEFSKVQLTTTLLPLSTEVLRWGLVLTLLIGAL